MKSNRRFLWTYGGEALESAMRRSFAARVIRDYGITDLFLSMSGALSPDGLNDSTLSAVIRDVSPLAVHAMVFQDSYYLDFSPGVEEEIRRTVAVINRYNLGHWDTRIAGIHLDVEPHARADFRSGPCGSEEGIHSLFSRYTGLLKCFRAHIDLSLGLSEPDFVFSAATGWWYEGYSAVSMAVLCRYLDAIVPMAYNSKSEPVDGDTEHGSHDHCGP